MSLALNSLKYNFRESWTPAKVRSEEVVFLLIEDVVMKQRMIRYSLLVGLLFLALAGEAKASYYGTQVTAVSFSSGCQTAGCYVPPPPRPCQTPVPPCGAHGCAGGGYYPPYQQYPQYPQYPYYGGGGYAYRPAFICPQGYTLYGASCYRANNYFSFNFGYASPTGSFGFGFGFPVY